MGAPGRHARHESFGRFRDDAAVACDDSNALPGSDSMTVVLVGRLNVLPDATEALFDHADLRFLDPPPAAGFSMSATASDFLLSVAQSDGFLSRNYLSVTTPVTAPTPIVWCASINSDVVTSRVNGAEVSDTLTAGWMFVPNTLALGPAAFGINMSNGGVEAPSFYAGALIATMSEVANLAAVEAVVIDNLAQGRALDTGLPFAAEFYLDAGDWPGYGSVVDRVGSVSFTPFGSVERGELLGKVAA